MVKANVAFLSENAYNIGKVKDSQSQTGDGETTNEKEAHYGN